jgi:N-acetyl-alpha-D-muramate 1-phosphate uridylyltransferase
MKPKTALIFAAGRGERMRPLTLNCPKPLLRAGAYSLIEWQLRRLRGAGIRRVVINVSYCAEAIVAALGDGSAWDVQIVYSDEGATPLETGGGIRFALDLLGKESFLVCNGDVYSEFDYARLELPEGALANLVLVPNPSHHPEGDFILDGDRCRTCMPTRARTGCELGARRWTFSGIGVYQPSLFANLPHGSYRLAPILREAMNFGDVRGELYQGPWTDVGTPQRLAELDQQLQTSAPRVWPQQP